ncbi:MAG: DUF6116 family protein [Xanthomonadales bacterium]|jgi:hypothetical protein|nr:DUF6116 family protein [Xanthomonadales bacterium]
MNKLMRGGVAGVFLRWASRLRFPYLFLVTTILFIFNLFIPDALPLADELVMGLVAVLLANLRKKSGNEPNEVSREATENDHSS